MRWLIALSFLFVSSAYADIMKVGPNAIPPIAAQRFCATQSPLCVPKGTKRFVLTEQLEKVLKSVNQEVNRSIKPTIDKGDTWTVAPKKGDCEDYALTKKSRLITLGFPSSALLITIVLSNGTGHAVLTVTTDKGDLIMDNLTSTIKRWESTPYKYLQRQSQTASRKWVTIS